MSSRIFRVEKDQKTYQFTEQQFEKFFQVRPLFYLEAAKPKYINQIMRKCNRALKKGRLSERRIWLGTYYKREISEGRLPKVTIKWINGIRGYGLFTNKPVLKKRYIGEYTGLLRKQKRSLDETNSYCFEYFIDDERTNFTIDAKEQGNHVRFINHNTNGNLEPILVYVEGIMHVILIARRNIEAGEELTYDYGEDYWKRREAPTC